MVFYPLFLFITLTILTNCSTPKERGERISLLSPSFHEVLQLLVEVADEPSEQQQGLMFRRNISEGGGMLFVFPEPRMLSFWMKNTLIPLDVIFFDSQGMFVSSQRMVPCSSDPCSLYNSDSPARYALEVPAGYVEEHGVGAKWQLRFP